MKRTFQTRDTERVVLDGMNSGCKSTEASKLLGLFGN